MPFCNIPKRAVLCGNTAWGMANFRAPLISRLIGEGYDCTVLAPAGSESVDIERLGASFRAVSMTSQGTNPLAELRVGWHLFKQLRSMRPAIVFAFTIKCVIYAGIACRLLRIPFIPTITGLGSVFISTSWVTWVAERLYRIACRKAVVVFFLNEADKHHFVGRAIVSANVARMIPGEGIDTDFFSPVPGGPAVSNPFRFLYCGRLLADKGVYELVAAMRHLREAGLPVHLDVVGFADWDNPTAVSSAEIETWQREGLLTYHGPSKDVRHHIAAADCVVLPSYREGLSRVLLESAAMGKPMVATDVPGCREIVIDGETGFTCPPRSAEGLAQAMQKMAIASAHELARLAARARALVVDRYSTESVTALYLEQLPELAAAG